jgi:hypothetical protein
VGAAEAVSFAAPREAVVRVVSSLLDDVARLGAGEPAILGAVADRLDAVARGLGAARVTVAVDDEALGRQVFTSGRRLLGDDTAAIWADAGVWTDPPSAIDGTAAELLVHAVTLAVALANRDPRDARDRGSALEPWLGEAVARAVDVGWAFTLAIVHFDAPLDDASGAALRAALAPGDSVTMISAREAALLLPAITAEEVPARLEAASAAGRWPRCVYGVAHCPGDGNTTAAVLDHAVRGLELAADARYPAIARQ